MAITLGTADPSAIMLSGSPVSKVMMGESQVWPASSSPPWEWQISSYDGGGQNDFQVLVESAEGVGRVFIATSLAADEGHFDQTIQWQKSRGDGHLEPGRSACLYQINADTDPQLVRVRAQGFVSIYVHDDLEPLAGGVGSAYPFLHGSMNGPYAGGPVNWREISMGTINDALYRELGVTLEDDLSPEQTQAAMSIVLDEISIAVSEPTLVVCVSEVDYSQALDHLSTHPTLLSREDAETAMLGETPSYMGLQQMMTRADDFHDSAYTAHAFAVPSGTITMVGTQTLGGQVIHCAAIPISAWSHLVGTEEEGIYDRIRDVEDDLNFWP